MKAYTDIEQSKKLAEILPAESADMYWWATSKRYYIEAMDDGDFNEREGHIRAWSLSALLAQMSCVDLESSQDNHYRAFWHKMCSAWHESAVDACVELITRKEQEK